MLNVDSKLIQKSNPCFARANGSLLGRAMFKYTERLAPASDTFVTQGLRRASNMEERREFAELFYEAISEKNRESLEMPQYLRRLIKFGFQIFPIEIIKEGDKVVGGFSFNIKRRGMCIGAMALDSSKRGTPEGRGLVKLMGRRIKQIASDSGVETINILVDQNAPGLVNLYKQAGFRIIGESLSSYRMAVRTEDFMNV